MERVKITLNKFMVDMKFVSLFNVNDISSIVYVELANSIVSEQAQHIREAALHNLTSNQHFH